MKNLHMGHGLQNISLVIEPTVMWSVWESIPISKMQQ